MLELQSTSDYSMALRLRNYVTQYYLALVQNHKGGEPYPLPHVIPLVLYTGFATWKGPLTLQEMLPTNPLGAWEETTTQQFKFILLDAARINWHRPDKSLAEYLIGCLQTYSNKNDMPSWRDIKRTLHELDRDAARISWMRLYMSMLARNVEVESMIEDLIPSRFYPIAATMNVDEIDAYLDSLEADGELVPLGGRIRIKGQSEGYAKGHTEGLAEGRTAGLAEGRTAGLAEGRTEGLAEGRTEGLAEGRTEGLAEGRIAGLNEGRAAGQAETTANFILWRYANCPQRILNLVRTSQDPEFLERVAKAILATNTLEEFLQSTGL